ncbi:MAG: YihY/virulence factor BrkB family protein [Opitutaceae bacterium]|nr:YihY/virulence factor BrkB family protein [Opitutaceae bacterium]
MPRPVQTTSPSRLRPSDAWARFAHIYQKEIWKSSSLKERSLRGGVYAVLRVLSITVLVFDKSRLASRAAALSFSSLLGLGPLLAIAFLVAGFALGKDEPNLVANTLTKILKFVAPQLQQYEYLTQSPTDINPDLVNIINGIIAAAQSGSAGALGGTSLILIVLLLFKSIEDAFNDIWGVRQGRSVLMRIVLYWTVLTLGAVLFFSSVALLSAGTFGIVFGEILPGGPEMAASLGGLLPLLSLVLLAIMLMLFYRVIPNTRVSWSAAFVGAMVAATLVVMNQFVQFLYVKRVVLERSLYGSLAILPVLMFGLYIFWLCVLIGGIVSYAVQNVHFRNSQVAWSSLTHAMRERLALVVFMTICRRFRECLPPISSSQLGELLKVPTQLLNECVNRLVLLNLIATVRPDPNADSTDYLYQPARPLNRLTLLDFKTLDDNFGEDPIGASLERIDPLLTRYDIAISRLGEQEFFQKNLDQLFDEIPFDESRPPFAMGSRTAQPATGELK